MKPTVDHLAASDCERCRPGLVAQPVNTVTSLAFCVSGALVLRRARHHHIGRPSETALGWAAIAAGLGSVAYHGPGTPLGRYAHDATLLATMGLVALADAEVVTGNRAPPALVAAVPVVAAVAAHSTTSMAAQGLTGVAVALAEGLRMRSAPGSGRGTWRRSTETLVAGGGAIVHVLGRTGGPLCRPDRILQAHGVWHVATASALWLRTRDLVVPRR